MLGRTATLQVRVFRVEKGMEKGMDTMGLIMMDEELRVEQM